MRPTLLKFLNIVLVNCFEGNSNNEIGFFKFRTALALNLFIVNIVFTTFLVTASYGIQDYLYNLSIGVYKYTTRFSVTFLFR